MKHSLHSYMISETGNQAVAMGVELVSMTVHEILRNGRSSNHRKNAPYRLGNSSRSDFV
ncbi:hypothetical protein [Umezakia ovalisporum]|uniref:Uncharacterized protein n=2 Tax=Umezakia ovalisporum TaxID=75695 RepID=A0AA43H1Q1_9CYAN|nr:hypothetical protein [Umezakia ovalisporum]MDH6056867.1 hypothetical protein [Umezakia ovalisporum FSS-43]MDH6065649.1 hypothetical protein [Umezakia ovalisporum FSS-62]MDH6068049.1 hypothetical protein [Umezakia ovalisporum APH033B]MDH6070874.1 hypothetical protein [Umezakia ovalisporum CobakiLakeA]MDH6077137.1 hypothetical protein [Umezakia ovalisporum FSS-45]